MYCLIGGVLHGVFRSVCAYRLHDSLVYLPTLVLTTGGNTVFVLIDEVVTELLPSHFLCGIQLVVAKSTLSPPLLRQNPLPWYLWQMSEPLSIFGFSSPFFSLVLNTCLYSNVSGRRHSGLLLGLLTRIGSSLSVLSLLSLLRFFLAFLLLLSLVAILCPVSLMSLIESPSVEIGIASLSPILPYCSAGMIYNGFVFLSRYFYNHTLDAGEPATTTQRPQLCL